MSNSITRKPRAVTRIANATADTLVAGAELVASTVTVSQNILRSAGNLADASFYLTQEMAIESQLESIRNLGELAGLAEAVIKAKCVEAMSHV